MIRTLFRLFFNAPEVLPSPSTVPGRSLKGVPDGGFEHLDISSCSSSGRETLSNHCISNEPVGPVRQDDGSEQAKAKTEPILY